MGVLLQRPPYLHSGVAQSAPLPASREGAGDLVCGSMDAGRIASDSAHAHKLVCALAAVVIATGTIVYGRRRGRRLQSSRQAARHLWVAGGWRLSGSGCGQHTPTRRAVLDVRGTRAHYLYSISHYFPHHTTSHGILTHHPKVAWGWGRDVTHACVRILLAAPDCTLLQNLSILLLTSLALHHWGSGGQRVWGWGMGVRGRSQQRPHSAAEAAARMVPSGRVAMQAPTCESCMRCSFQGI